MNNIMCIPATENCPLNEIKTRLSENSNIYETCKYFNYTLYFTNQNINNRIITNLTVSDKLPKYITEDNFIFDEDAYDYNDWFKSLKIYTSYSGSGGHNNFDDNGGDRGVGGGGDSGGGGGGVVLEMDLVVGEI